MNGVQKGEQQARSAFSCSGNETAQIFACSYTLLLLEVSIYELIQIVDLDF